MFISCGRIGFPYAADLVKRLREEGLPVSHSPRNPMDGNDERWRNWYEGDGQFEIANSAVFVVIVTPGWDCSTWMAFEAEEACKGLQQGHIRRMLHYNPNHTEIHYMENKLRWLGEPLPDDLEETVELLKSICDRA